MLRTSFVTITVCLVVSQSTWSDTVFIEDFLALPQAAQEKLNPGDARELRDQIFSQFADADSLTHEEINKVPDGYLIDCAVLLKAQKYLGRLGEDASSGLAGASTGIADVVVAKYESPWVNDDLRKGYDRAQKVTSGLGAALVAASAIFASTDNKSATTITGIVGAVGLIIAPYLGSTDVSKIKERTDRAAATLQQVDLSRRAYDDIAAQKVLYDKTRQLALDRLNRLAPLDDSIDSITEKLFRGAVVPRSDIQQTVDNLLVATSDWQLVLELHLQSFEALESRLHHFASSYPGLKENLKGASEDVADMRGQIDEKVVARLGDVRGLRKDMQDWLEKRATLKS